MSQKEAEIAKAIASVMEIIEPWLREVANSTHMTQNVKECRVRAAKELARLAVELDNE